MKKIKLLAVLIAATFAVTSCFEDLDDNAISASEIRDFVWKGMNAVYLYKSDIPDLANDRFTNDEAYASYLNSFESPEDLFGSILYLPETVDRFSRITDNYFDLQNQQDGISLNNGLEFNLYRLNEGSNIVFGAITLVLNNSIADNSGLERGMIFGAVDGINLTDSNFEQLLFEQNSYTLNFANYDDNGTIDVLEDDSITLNGESAVLTKVEYIENPVHVSQTLTLSDNTKVGYLMYNQFNPNFDGQLNNAFSQFQSENIDELVIDLRYNGGGSVQTAAYLGSMVTGQFTGQTFSKLFYNENLNNFNRDFQFVGAFEGGGAITNLNLSKVYVLTTNLRTASASELVVNSLKPYIEVVVIGENTVGKTQASITIYDSPDLSFNDVNPRHTYAMQPLIANSTNVNDQLVPANGILPDISISERRNELGTLGNPEERLLAAAIADILGTGRSSFDNLNQNLVRSKKYINALEQDMYIK